MRSVRSVRFRALRAIAVATTLVLGALAWSPPAGAWRLAGLKPRLGSNPRDRRVSGSHPSVAAAHGREATVPSESRRRFLAGFSALVVGGAIPSLAPKSAHAGLRRVVGRAHEALYYHVEHVTRARYAFAEIRNALESGKLNVHEVVRDLRELAHFERKHLELASGEDGVTSPAIGAESREAIYAALERLTPSDSNVVAGIRVLASASEKEYVAHAAGFGIVANFKGPDTSVDHARAARIAGAFSTACREVSANTKRDVSSMLDRAYQDVVDRLPRVEAALAPALEAERARR